jgi:hypothetical protein
VVEKKEDNVAEKVERDIKTDHEKDMAKELRRMEATLQMTNLAKESLQKALEQEKTQHLATSMTLANTRILLGEVTKLHNKETARANAAESQVKELGAIRHALEKRDTELDNLRNRLMTAEDSLKAQREELDTAERNARMVKEQLITISNEMKTSEKAGARKRNADNNASRRKGKKAKTEEE